MWDRVGHMLDTGYIETMGPYEASDKRAGLRVKPGRPGMLGYAARRPGRIEYLAPDGTVIGSTAVDAAGKVTMTGIGKRDLRLPVLAFGDSPRRLTPADGRTWLDGLMQHVRTPWVRARWA